MPEPDTKPDERKLNQKAIENEQVKLAATTINTVGLALAGTGTIVPVVTFFAQGEAPKSPLWPAVALVCLMIAAAAHLSARWTLGRIKA